MFVPIVIDFVSVSQSEMQIKNSQYSYGLGAIVLHWGMALLIVGLFILGVYMVELDYYDSWYNAAPWWHKALGMIVLAMLLLRITWTIANRRPSDLPGYHKLEMVIARLTHVALYFLMLLVCISGYFITTAKGAGIDIFGWFTFPALGRLETQQAELAGKIHALSSYMLGLLFALHMVASCKHHFSDQDATLKRIINPAFKGD